MKVIIVLFQYARGIDDWNVIKYKHKKSKLCKHIPHVNKQKWIRLATEVGGC